jgi:hypothetical protein
MSATNQTAGLSTSSSTDNFIAIFNAASTEYQRVTGKHLQTHPFAAQLDACHSSKAVSDLLRTQTQAFSTFRKGDDKLMAWLDPMINNCPPTFDSQPFSPAKTIFTGIGVLLGVSFSPNSSSRI